MRCNFCEPSNISHLAVIFVIVKCANHCMYCITFCVASSIYVPVAYIDVLIISAGCKPACSYSGVMESEAMGLFTVESVTTFARRCGQVLSGSMEPLRGH